MASKDERVKCITEAIKGIRVLKYHVWEDHFVKKIKSKFHFFYYFDRGPFT